MSVIIRLQNLPWSANALDIRQFFRGLSIPEGGVHIVGGEMGDAFIAFSTDEDARQAMMHDREAINGVQIRLLLSSRAEMQKVIEIARQQSLLALKKATGGAILAQPKSSPPIVVAPPSIKNTVMTTAPQPPVITASSFQNILTSTTATAAATPSFLAYQQQAGFTLIPETKNTTTATKNNLDSDDSESRHDRDRRRSDSRDRRRSRSHSRERSIFRRRRERSRDRSHERDWPNGRRSSRHRSRSRERSRARSRERSRDRSRERERSRNNNSRDNNRRSSRDSGNNNNRPRSMDSTADNKPKSNISPWSTTTNAYQASYSSTDAGQQSFMRIANYQATFNNSNNMGNDNKPMEAINIQNYNTSNQSLTALNNYSLSGILNAGNSNDSFKGFALQNPYTTALNASANLTGNVSNTTSSSSIPGIFVEKKTMETNVTTVDNEPVLTQEPIAFANVNPYEQMYPTLFAQAAALSSGQKSLNTKQNTSNMSSMDSPKAEDTKPKEVDPNETNCIKISNMCSRTTYSDLRKFFVGLFIPHNGIKMLNDKHGLRVGIAYVQFSKQSSVAKALCRSKNLLKGKTLIIEAVDEQEFNEAEDSFRPPNQDKEYGHRGNESDDATDESVGNNNSGFSALNPYKKMIQLEPFTVLYIEDIPSLATEQDIMKMFSSYSLYDILLIASPENRREFVAYVRFSREEDAKSAFEDRAHHQIGYRRVRMRPSTIEEMENAKEKIRLANEQLMKEEQAAEEEEAKRKLEKLITEHIEKEESKQQNIVSMDLTQEDADDDDDQVLVHDDDDVIVTSNELNINNDKSNKAMMNNMNNRENFEREAEILRQNDIYSMQGNKFSSNLDPRRPQTPNIPSLFDLNPMNSINPLQNQNRSNLFNDPRLRSMSERSTNSSVNSVDNNQQQSNPVMGPNNYNNFNPNFNNQQQMNMTAGLNNMHNNFVILKNCEYNTRINDVAQLLLTANLALKHIEPLRNERQLPTGEFIVEFRRNNDAEIAVQRFHNIQFRNRSLRVFPITPQEIADRLGKPFLSYIPGGNGVRITKGMINDSITRNLNMPNNNMNNCNNNNNNNNRFRGNNVFNDNGPLDNDNNVNAPNNNNNGRSNNGGGGGGNGGGIPEQFTRPGCVLSLENVPYKAQLSDILNFFQGFDLTPDDIIRRFNDDGSPTGDARVAFMSPDQARSAFESKKRKKLFGRNIFIKII
ncbi:homeobox protein 2 [Lucilia cuprina]|uniref:homeobox protein 2 n=1 Tax=Lucilia cuprina TaxID=7375 RepID=UPI001F051ECC|nr:homeobox protein 2 [Lucilia cuprina]